MAKKQSNQPTGSDQPTGSKQRTGSNQRTGSDQHSEVVVLGGGPGGYTAAFRAADLGKQVTLIERYPVLGGVCLNVGCIPSKALLHIAQVIHEAEALSEFGVEFGKPRLTIDSIRQWKERVTQTLTTGLAGLAQQRNIEVIEGTGAFVSDQAMQIEGDETSRQITFDHAIIAAGSRPTRIPAFPNDDPRLMDSTDALNIEAIPERLLIIGGGIIGLEMATFYHALGSDITVVELMDQIIPGCDKDLVKPLAQHIKKQYQHIRLNTKVVNIKAEKAGLEVLFEGPSTPQSALFDRVLVAVGRRPNGHLIAAEAAGIQVNEAGFILVDEKQRTNVPHIHAIGDIVGNPMLAHKATHEGKVAAEVIAGLPSAFRALTVPSVAYTDPEVAWMGLTENQAKQQSIEYEKAAFPWAASGRALSLGRKEGVTKILCDKASGRVLGVGIVGCHAGELIAEAVLALEMGATAEDLALTIHPHPTLSETLGFAAEMIEGSITDLYLKRR